MYLDVGSLQLPDNLFWMIENLHRYRVRILIYADFNIVSSLISIQQEEGSGGGRRGIVWDLLSVKTYEASKLNY